MLFPPTEVPGGAGADTRLSHHNSQHQGSHSDLFNPWLTKAFICLPPCLILPDAAIIMFSCRILNIERIISRFSTCVSMCWIPVSLSKQKIIIFISSLTILSCWFSDFNGGPSCAMQAIHLFNLCERIISNIKYAPCLALQSTLPTTLTIFFLIKGVPH